MNPLVLGPVERLVRVPRPQPRFNGFMDNNYGIRRNVKMKLCTGQQPYARIKIRQKIEVTVLRGAVFLGYFNSTSHA